MEKLEKWGNEWWSEWYHWNQRAEARRQALAQAIENTRKDETIPYTERQERIRQYKEAMETTWV